MTVHGQFTMIEITFEDDEIRFCEMKKEVWCLLFEIPIRPSPNLPQPSSRKKRRGRGKAGRKGGGGLT